MKRHTSAHKDPVSNRKIPSIDRRTLITICLLYKPQAYSSAWMHVGYYEYQIYWNTDLLDSMS